MQKILITGGSGFIGTNLVQHFIGSRFEILNIDAKSPANKQHAAYWVRADITNLPDFEKATLDFMPDYVVHLAARVDLEGKKLNDYSANTIGVRNLLDIVKKVPNLKKLLVTSSMLVCRVGYVPQNQFDFCPTTIYGKSKVETERLLWASPPECDWAIIRPTSIWGPWFGTPYRDFFDLVMNGRYVKFGKQGCTKTYGFVGNSVYQISCILFTQTKKAAEKVFYIGDYPPTNINEWADEIANELGTHIRTAPFPLIRMAALAGDLLKRLGISFPITSFRLKNMTTNNVLDVLNTIRIAPNSPFTRKMGIKLTIDWLRSPAGQRQHQ